MYPPKLTSKLICCSAVYIAHSYLRTNTILNFSQLVHPYTYLQIFPPAHPFECLAIITDYPTQPLLFSASRLIRISSFCQHFIRKYKRGCELCRSFCIAATYRIWSFEICIFELCGVETSQFELHSATAHTNPFVVAHSLVLMFAWSFERTFSTNRWTSRVKQWGMRPRWLDRRMMAAAPAHLQRPALVMKQVTSSSGSAVVIREPHDWSSTLTSCCDDCRICKLTNRLSCG